MAHMTALDAVTLELGCGSAWVASPPGTSGSTFSGHHPRIHSLMAARSRRHRELPTPALRDNFEGRTWPERKRSSPPPQAAL
eukprot:3133360-Amphidinium_carterae.1